MKTGEDGTLKVSSYRSELKGTFGGRIKKENEGSRVRTQTNFSGGRLPTLLRFIVYRRRESKHNFIRGSDMLR